LEHFLKINIWSILLNNQIESFINLKKLAFIGLSANPKKFGNLLYKELIKRSYELFPIHIREKVIDGIVCYPSIEVVKDKVEGIIINTNPKNTLQILDELKKNNITKVWLQPGAESKEVIVKANDLNLSLITNKCLLMYAEPVKGIHKLHRFLKKLFGKL